MIYLVKKEITLQSSSKQALLVSTDFLCKAVLLLLQQEISVDHHWEMQKGNNLIFFSKGNAFLGAWPLSFYTSNTISSSVLYRMRHMYNLKIISCMLISDCTGEQSPVLSYFHHFAFSKADCLQAGWANSFFFLLSHYSSLLAPLVYQDWKDYIVV